MIMYQDDAARLIQQGEAQYLRCINDRSRDSSGTYFLYSLQRLRTVSESEIEQVEEDVSQTGREVGSSHIWGGEGELFADRCILYTPCQFESRVQGEGFYPGNSVNHHHLLPALPREVSKAVKMIQKCPGCIEYI